MSDDCLQEVFCSTVLARLVYASPAWLGFFSASDVNKLDRFSTGANVSNTASLNNLTKLIYLSSKLKLKIGRKEARDMGDP